MVTAPGTRALTRVVNEDILRGPKRLLFWTLSVVGLAAIGLFSLLMVPTSSLGGASICHGHPTRIHLSAAHQSSCALVDITQHEAAESDACAGRLEGGGRDDLRAGS